MLRIGNTSLVIILVIFSFIVRLLFIWIGRTEFVGWFNHTYYYYVQTRGLINTGTLPFADMPLLFHLYAVTAKALVRFGLELNTAIVNATRLWMCLIPSLTVIPVYAVIRRFFSTARFPGWTWMLLFGVAFYPLSVLYIPEFLQKNALGLLLIALLIWLSSHVMTSTTVKSILALAILFLLIVFTHYGSTGAAVLYLSSFSLSAIINRKKKKGIFLILVSVIALALAIGGFYLFDDERLHRVVFYINRIADSSVIGMMISSQDQFDKIAGMLVIILPFAITLFFLRLYSKAKHNISIDARILWLSNIIFCYFLVLPVYDQLLLGRFSLFIPLPLSLVLFFTMNHIVSRQWIRKVILGLLLFAVILMGFGEFMSLKFHNRDKEEVFSSLKQMQSHVDFSKDDLVIARNGVEHISNWFLGTKSSVITSFNENDFEKYERIFILNPTERGMAIQGKPNAGIMRYNYMLGNIPEPGNGIIVYESGHMKLIELKAPPPEWVFDDEGYWLKYD